MTDAEIIKALECCTTKGTKCSDCPAFKKVDRSDCKKYFRGAIDLINRQQAQLADERAKIEICAETISRQDAEIERLTILAKLGNMRADDYRVMREKCKTARAEAIKEFAYRLKQKSEYYENGQGWEGRICYDDDIDKLLKEMVGEE